MANITPSVPTIAGAAAAFAATEVAGDSIVYAAGSDVIVEFHNTGTGSVTVNFVPTKTSDHLTGAGPVTIPTRSLAIAAAAHASFLFKSNEVRAYINASGNIPITYTGGATTLLIRAQKVGG